MNSTKEERQEVIQSSIGKMMDRDPKLTYGQAWQRFKSSPEGKPIFAQMEKGDESRRGSKDRYPLEDSAITPATQRRADLTATLDLLQSSGCSYDEAWNIATNLPEFQDAAQNGAQPSPEKQRQAGITLAARKLMVSQGLGYADALLRSNKLPKFKS